MSRIGKAWFNLALLVITLIVNTLGAIGLINGFTQKQISDMYVTLITPGPATFSIWSVIYSLLIISIIAMIVKKNDPYFQAAVDKVSVLFWISCLINIVWIVSFSFLLVELSAFFIFCFVIVLSLICVKLLQIQVGKRWLLPLSFALYTGWLTIATVVNISAALVKLKWNGFGIDAETWAIIILTIAVLLVLGILLKIRNAAYPLPVAWAYFGIYQFLNSPAGFKGKYGFLQTVALIGMAALIIISAVQLYRNRFSVLPDISKKTQK